LAHKPSPSTVDKEQCTTIARGSSCTCTSRRQPSSTVMHACMHACTHARSTHAKAAPTTESWTSVASNHGTHCLTIARDLVAPRGSGGSGRTHLFDIVCSQRSLNAATRVTAAAAPPCQVQLASTHTPKRNLTHTIVRAKNAWHLAGERARCAATQGSVEGRVHVDARGSGCVSDQHQGVARAGNSFTSVLLIATTHVGA
jgi:hypothetical protein